MRRPTTVCSRVKLRTKPPASSVICSMLLAMVSSASSLPAVPSPSFSRSVTRLDVGQRSLHAVDALLQALHRGAQLGAGRAHLAFALADQALEPFADLAHVAHGDLDVVGFGAGDGFDVPGDVVHPLQQALEHDRVARDQIVGVVGDLLDRPRGDGLHVAQDLLQDRQGQIHLVDDLADVGRFVDVFDPIAVPQHLGLPGGAADGVVRRAGIDRPGRTRPAATPTASRRRRCRTA